MKKLGIKFSSLFFALALVFGSTAVVCAADTTSAETTAGAGTQAAEGGSTLTINNAASVEVGKTVTYTLYLSEATESIVGFELRLFYDSDFLEYQKNTLKFDKFDVVFFNEDIKGKIPMNYTSLNNQPLFDKKGQFLTANFKVLNGGNANISYFFTEYAEGRFFDTLKTQNFMPPANKPFGSVGLTAVYYALKFRKDETVPVYVTGLDFSYSTGLTHTKGALAHILRLIHANRLNPPQNYAAAYGLGTEKIPGKNGHLHGSRTGCPRS